MAKLVVSDVSNIFTAAATLNANNALIEAAIENTLSRDGTSPNEMNAILDMNNNRIINLPEPTEDTDPVRLIDVPSIAYIDEVFDDVVTLAAEAEEDATIAAASAATATAAAAILTSATVTGTGLATGGGLVTSNPVINVPKADAATVAAGISDGTAVTPLGLSSEGEHLLIEPSWTSGRKKQLRLLHRDWCRLDQDTNFDPTGSTNMNTVFAAAMTNYKKVIVPANSLVVMTTLNIVQDDQHIIGEGPSSLIRMANGGNTNLINATGRQRLRFENFTMDGNKTTQSAGNGSAIQGSNDIRFDGVRIISWFGNGLILQTSCSNIVVDGCYISDVGSHGVSLSETDTAQVLGCTIIDARLSGVNLGAVGNCTINNNVIRRNPALGATGGGAGGIRTTNNSKVVTICGNVISSYDRGILPITGAGQTTVSGNTILQPWYDGILIGGTPDTSFSQVDIAVTGNTILDANASNSGSYDGIRIADSCGAILTSGNTIRDQRGAPQMQYGIRDTSTGAASNIGRSASVNWIGGAAIAAVN